MSVKEVLEFNFLNLGGYHLNLLQVLSIFMILLIVRLANALINRLMNRYFHRRKVDSGRQFAFRQFIRYILYTIAVLTCTGGARGSDICTLGWGSSTSSGYWLRSATNV